MLTLDQKLELFELVGYKPHAEQMKAHTSGARVVMVVGAERSGKSEWTGAEGLASLTPDPQVLIAGREHKPHIALAAQAYDETWQECEYIIEWLKQLGNLEEASTPKQGPWSVKTKTGGDLVTVSLKEGAGELTGTGRPFDAVLLVEAGRIAYNAFMAARGRVAETRGRVLMSGTLWEDYGWYAEFAESFRGPNPWDGEVYNFPAWANTYVYPGGKDDPEIKALRKAMPHNEFMRRIAAQRVPSPARIFPEFSHELHVSELEWDREAPVDLSVDPGYFPSKYVVEVVQPTMDEQGREMINVVDELWVNNWTHQEVVRWCLEQEWADNVYRVYAGHEAKQHLYTKTMEDVWREMSPWPFHVVPRVRDKRDGIMRLKTFLEDPEDEAPRLTIHSGCQGLIYEFPRYERRTNPISKEVVSDDPAPRSQDDALDALTNYLVGRFGLVDKERKQGRKGRRRVPARG